MKVFQQDIRIAATAYIVAETEEEAREIVKRELTNVGAELLEESEGGFVRGADFDTLLEECEDNDYAPRATISPAITIEGPFAECVFEIAHEGDE